MMPAPPKICMEDGDDEDPGEEVRQVHDRLGDGPYPGPDHAVDEQREQDRDREEQHQLEEEQHERVLHRVPERRVREDPFELLEADPRALEDGDEAVLAEVRVVVLEGDDVAEDRHVVEDQDQQHRRQGHQDQRAVTLEPEPDAQLPPALVLGRDRDRDRDRNGDLERRPAPSDAAGSSAGVFASALDRGTVLWDTAFSSPQPRVSSPTRCRRAASCTSRAGRRRPCSSTRTRPAAHR